MECTCYIREYDDSTEPQLIKCKLCKAAPELYEALKHICDRLYGVADNDKEVSSNLYSLLKSLYLEGYAALAKVEK